MEEKRELKIKAEYDVIVAGGGIAGISAALSAAREGSKVTLIEKQCILGGLATAGLVTIYLPLCDGEGNQVSYGISEELLRLSIKHGWEDKYPFAWLEGNDFEARKEQRFEVRYNPHIFAVLAEQLLIKEGVTILYDTVICDVHMQGDLLDCLIIENKSGRTAIKGKSFVDATGDADICNFAKAECALFTPKNILANWYYYLSNGKLNLKMLGVVEMSDEDKKKNATATGQEPLINRRFGGLDGDEISQMLILGHEQMLKDILKKREENPDLVPVTMPSIPQLRMTRRVVGPYELDESEKFKVFDDSIGLIGNWRKRGPVYEIPFRTLYSKNVPNLITAGRCISVTDTMWDLSRVIPACAVTGEAAGLAAAMTNDFAKLDVSKLQEKLMQRKIPLHL